MNVTWLQPRRCSLALATAFLLLNLSILRAQAPEPAPEAPTEPAPTEAPPTPEAAPPDATTPEAPATEATTEPAAEGVAAEPQPPPGVNLPGKDPLEENFAAYLNFALVGKFEYADRFAQAFLNQPGVAERPLPPEVAKRVLDLSGRYKDSVDTLLTIIANTPISENAKKVLEVIRQSHRQARMSPERIKANLGLLSGTPVQEAVAIERLRESGEYAVPWMLETLADPKQQNLQPFIVRTLPMLGKKAVNPLVEALSLANPAVRGAAADALGQLGYPQALPYLQRVLSDPQANAAVKSAAQQAIDAIVVSDPRIKQRSAAELFRDLAEQYYYNAPSLRPDASEPRVNVWYLREDILTPVEVPPEIFQYVMAMRAARSSLAIDPAQPAVSALWLAANFRREAALGLDVTSAEQVRTADLTLPAEFPRSIYFARTLGPAINQLVLSRAVSDLDPTIALGSIAALNVTAGPAAMVQPAIPDAASLAAALHFPDLLVRIRAALALARALPQQPFPGSQEVVPVLATAVQLTGNRFYVLVMPDQSNRTTVEQALKATGASVVAAARFSDAMERAHRELTHLDGIFLSTTMQTPTVVEAVRTLAQDRRFALTPIVLIVGPNDNLLADRVAEVDRRVGRAFEVADGQTAYADLAKQLVARRDEIAGRFGHADLPAETSLHLALEAAHTLRLVALNRSSALDVRQAEPALSAALAQPSEELRIACCDALAAIDSATAQRAIGGVALNAEQTPTLRMAAFDALAESGRRFGNQLEPAVVKQLLEQAIGLPDLDLRTAASQAMGALNLSGRVVADVILQYSQGQ